MTFEWMYWTVPTAIFFSTIFLMIAGMLVWELVCPTVERRGFLKIPTTRGTRFFVGLLGTAYIHLAWLGLTDLICGCDAHFSRMDIYRHALGIKTAVPLLANHRSMSRSTQKKGRLPIVGRYLPSRPR
jgi:predicted small integral membrane protein